jgi:hypothetical protein
MALQLRALQPRMGALGSRLLHREVRRKGVPGTVRVPVQPAPHAQRDRQVARLPEQPQVSRYRLGAAICVGLLTLLALMHCDEANAAEKSGRTSFAESLAVHGLMRGANVATTRWSIAQGAREGNPAMAQHLEAKSAGIAVALALAETKLNRKQRRVLRLIHIAGTVAACVMDVRAGQKAGGAR